MKFLTQNLHWKLLSLLVAFGVWVLVSSEPELATFVSVPVQYKNLPEDLEISSNALETVALELRGPSGELRDFRESKAAVVLDMATVRPGERTFSVSPDTVQLPRGLRLIRSVPAQLHFDFERRVTRSIPVRVRFGVTQHGYEVASYSTRPEELAIAGPESRVNRSTTAVTDPLDLSGVVGQAEFRVNAFVAEPQVRFVSSPQVTVKVMVRRR